MTNAQRKQAKKKKQEKPSVISRLRVRWLQKRPVLFFVLGFIVLMAGFYAIWLSDFFMSHVTPQINTVNAKVSSFLLNILGQGTKPYGFNISSAKFSISIAKGCDAIEAMALFSVALLVFPARWTQKIIGVLAGILILYILNLGRIISLFLVGIHYPKAFELMHVEIWQFLFIIFAIGLWIFWIRWTRTEKKNAE